MKHPTRKAFKNRRLGRVKRLILMAMILLVSNAYAGGKGGNKDAAEDKDILRVIEKNLEAAEKEDFDAWLKTYHERARSCKA